MMKFVWSVRVNIVRTHFAVAKECSMVMVKLLNMSEFPGGSPQTIC